MKKQNQEETRARIVEGARRLFALYGFERTTVDEIAVSARVSKKTIYRHFPAKDDLVMAVVESIMDPTIAAVEEVFAAGRGFKETLLSVARVIEGLSAHVTPPMLQDMQHMPHVWEKIDARRRQVLGRYLELIRKSQRDGIVRKDVEADFLMALLTNLVSSLVTPRVLVGLGMMPGEFVKRIISLFLSGILTEKGRTRMEGRDEE